MLLASFYSKTVDYGFSRVVKEGFVTNENKIGEMFLLNV